MERKSIVTLHGRSIAKITLEPHDRWYEFRNKSGRIMFMVTREHLFDKDGNFFVETSRWIISE